MPWRAYVIVIIGYRHDTGTTKLAFQKLGDSLRGPRKLRRVGEMERLLGRLVSGFGGASPAVAEGSVGSAGSAG